MEWEVPTHNGKGSARLVKYGNINTGTTVEERMRIASKIINTILIEKNFEKPAIVSKNYQDILEQTIDLYTVGWRKSTLRVYKTITKSFRNFLGEMAPQEVSSEIVTNCFSFLKEHGASSHKIIKYRTLLKSLFSKAIEYQLTDVNPVLSVKIKKTKAISLKYFNDEQIAILRSVDKPKELQLGIQLLYYCFIRPAEARLLKVSDLNLDSSYIELRGSISKNKSTQKVVIPHQLKPLLDYLKNYPGDYYLIGKNGIPSNVPIPEKRLYVLHTYLLKKAEIIGRYSLYSWKHTGVVKAYKAGILLKDLQLQLRHYSLDMVNEYLKNLGVMDSQDLLNRYPTL